MCVGNWMGGWYGWAALELVISKDISRFLVCNADRNANQFAGKLDFSEVLIPYNWDSGWIPKRINEMIEVLNSERTPDGNFSCKNCVYARQKFHFDTPGIAKLLKAV